MLGDRLELSHPLSKGLGAYFPLAEGSGDRTFGISPNKNVGVFTNITPETSWLPSTNVKLPGYILDFNGSNSIVILGDHPSIKPMRAISISAWIYFRTLPSGTRFLSDWHQDGNLDRWLLYSVTNNEITFLVRGGSSGSVGGVAITLNTWHHIVGVFCGFIIPQIEVYLDGISQGTDTISGGPFSKTGAGADVVLGQTETGTSLDGYMADVRIYGRRLIQDEVIWLFDEPKAGILQPQLFTPAVAGGTILPQVVSAYYRINS